MSKQSNAKKAQGYNPKHEPPNCNFYESDQVEYKGFNGIYHLEKNIRCGIGGFAIKKRGLCNKHELNIKT